TRQVRGAFHRSSVIPIKRMIDRRAVHSRLNPAVVRIAPRDRTRRRFHYRITRFVPNQCVRYPEAPRGIAGHLHAVYRVGQTAYRRPLADDRLTHAQTPTPLELVTRNRLDPLFDGAGRQRPVVMRLVVAAM